MCTGHSIVGKGLILQTAVVEMWELLTEDRKKMGNDSSVL
jgi:hypothetical protein